MKKIKNFIALSVMLLSLIIIILMTVEFLKASRILESIYQPTEYYYLVTDKGYYAGHNKGVALFTDDYNEAIRFPPEIVNGEMDIFTGESWLVTMNDVFDAHPEAEFVKEEKKVEQSTKK